MVDTRKKTPNEARADDDEPAARAPTNPEGNSAAAEPDAAHPEGSHQAIGGNHSCPATKALERLKTLSSLPDARSNYKHFCSLQQKITSLLLDDESLNFSQFLTEIQTSKERFEKKILEQLHELPQLPPTIVAEYRDLLTTMQGMSLKTITQIDKRLPAAGLPAPTPMAQPQRYKFNIKAWHGEPAEFPEFLIQLKTGIEEMKLSPAQAANYIRTNLPPAMAGEIPLSLNAEGILKHLEYLLSDSGQYSRAIAQKILALGPRIPNQPDSLNKFYNLVITSYSNAQYLHIDHPLKHADFINQLIECLPMSEATLLASYITEKGPAVDRTTLFIEFSESRGAVFRVLSANRLGIQEKKHTTLSSEPTSSRNLKRTNPKGARDKKTVAVHTAMLKTSPENPVAGSGGASTHQKSDRSNNNSEHIRRFNCRIVGCQDQSNFHHLESCLGFQKMNSLLRASLLVNWQRCSVCLRRAHAGGEQECNLVKSKDIKAFCKSCQAYHHETVCPKTFPEGMQVPGFKVFVGMASDSLSIPETLMSQETLTLPHMNGPKLKVNILYDTGAALSFVREDFAEKNSLPSDSKIFLEVSGINNSHDIAGERKVYQVNLGGQQVDLIGVPEITTLKGISNAKELVERYSLDSNSLNEKDMIVEILLGSDLSTLLPRFHSKVGEYVLTKSVLSGKMILQGGGNMRGQKRTVGLTKCQILHVRQVKTDLENTFIRAESLGTSPARTCKQCLKCEHCNFSSLFQSKKETEELKLIEKNLTFNESTKRWTARYPKKVEIHNLTDNYHDALKRLNSLERKLKRDDNLHNQFVDVFKEAVDRGLYRRLSTDEINQYEGKVRYSPLVLVAKDSESTPLRVCADSSCSSGGLSLNDCLIKGPSALNDLFSVLLRFRTLPEALLGDLKKFYNSVDSHTEDQHLRRILWRNMESSRDPDIYVTTCVTFGDLPAGVVTQTAARLSCEGWETKFPEAVEMIIRDSYVDDLLRSGKTSHDLKRISQEADFILNQHGFCVKKWIQSGIKEEVKVLGVHWNAGEDALVLHPKFIMNSRNKKTELEFTLENWADLPATCTKRQVYSATMSLYDPMGFLSPLIIQLKLCMREISTHHVEWDENVPDASWQKFKTTMQEILSLDGFSIPRPLCSPEMEPLDKPEADMVVFVDASSIAICSMVYLIMEQNGERYPSLIAAKTKIAPQPQPTVPKLELLAAQLGARLSKHAESAYTNVSVKNKFFLTDSAIVLFQLNKRSLQPDVFTTSKIFEVLSKSEAHQWFHIDTHLNISDLGTRTDAMAKDISEGFFLQGPDFLRLPADQWPIRTLEDLKRNSFSVPVHVSLPCEGSPPHKMFPSFGKPLQSLLQVVGLVVSAVVKFKQKINKSFVVQDVPVWTHEDNKNIKTEHRKAYNLGFHTYAALSQGKIHSLLASGKLKNLSPTTIKIEALPGLPLIVAGLRQGANVALNRSTPLPILPADCELAKKIITLSHLSTHGGVDTTNLESKKHAWILGSRKLALQEVRNCHKCRLEKEEEVSQIMGPLPEYRLLPVPPFLHVQADLAGPYTLKCTHHPRKHVKHWVLVTACQSLCGALSLVSIPGYSADDICRGLTILSNRWGRFRSIQSDAGPNMVKAVSLYNSRSPGPPADHIQVAPRAQHRNGRVERSVGLFKRLLPPSIVDQQPVHVSDFDLILSNVENQLNSRPIGTSKRGSELDSSTLITPNHVLQVGRTLDPAQPYATEDNPLRVKDCLKKLMVQVFERLAEVTIPLVCLTKKWRTDTEPLKPGTFVAFRSPNPLGKNPWSKGIIVDSITSKLDKKIRTYLVRTLQDGKITIKTLPITKLVILEEFNLEADDDEDSGSSKGQLLASSADG